MLCNCGEAAFTYVKYEKIDESSIRKIQVGKCGRINDELCKKKIKCSFNTSVVVGENCETSAHIKNNIPIVKTESKLQDDYYSLIINRINLIKFCQDNNMIYLKHLNSIIYYTNFLNIRPYIPEKESIDEYETYFRYRYAHPLSVTIVPKPILPQILVEGIDELIPRRRKKIVKKLKVIKSGVNTHSIGSLAPVFITGLSSKVENTYDTFDIDELLSDTEDNFDDCDFSD